MESWSLDLRRLEKQLINNKSLTFGAVRVSVSPPAAPSECRKGSWAWLRCPCASQGCHCNPGVFHGHQSPGEGPLEPEVSTARGSTRAGQGALCWWEHFPWLCCKTLSTHSPPIVLLCNQGQPGWGKKGNQNVNTGWSFLQGNSAMAHTEKRESSPFFLYLRISLKLSLFVWTIKYSNKNPFRGKGGWYQGFSHNITSIMGYISLTKYTHIYIYL